MENLAKIGAKMYQLQVNFFPQAELFPTGGWGGGGRNFEFIFEFYLPVNRTRILLHTAFSTINDFKNVKIF